MRGSGYTRTRTAVGRPPRAGSMKVEAGDLSAINLSVQQVLSLWAHGTVLRSLTGNRG